MPNLQDIAPIGKLVNLQSLTINARSVTDISALANLKNLKSVELREYDDGQFSDLSAVAHVPSVTIN